MLFSVEEECDHLISLAKPHMRKSTVVDSATGTSKDSRFGHLPKFRVHGWYIICDAHFASRTHMQGADKFRDVS
jgi:hypothetical protein